MHKLYKNKRGFTLVEVIIVVAIIVILAGVISLNISRIYGTARAKEGSVDASVIEMQGKIVASEAKVARYKF
ncbi:MAG: prepilin-type N-terminal cleavage/methylation domain-containing protein [Clostridiales bacterium]|jgi:prepilin-type N-terminal cleavage/methylation domain-containing protein|nr:prepilin-type N-terminal cleavage/methylation domain-containing protein [Clostridiales bacterium]HAW16001.1 hypothetical protein [Clostridiales bacterium]